MNCITTTTTLSCTPCENPISYLFELGKLALSSDYGRSTYEEVVDYLLTEGLVLNNCSKCCPDCGIYVFASLETFIKLNDVLNLLEESDCCINYIGSIMSAADEPVNNSEYFIDKIVNIYPCCSIKTFDCFNDSICLHHDIIQGDITVTSEFIDRMLDKGVIEYGGLYNNCTGEVTSQFCTIVNAMKQIYNSNYPTPVFYSSVAEAIDRLIDKGIVIECKDDKVYIFSVETWIERTAIIP